MTEKITTMIMLLSTEVMMIWLIKYCKNKYCIKNNKFTTYMLIKSSKVKKKNNSLKSALKGTQSASHV